MSSHQLTDASVDLAPLNRERGDLHQSVQAEGRAVEDYDPVLVGLNLANAVRQAVYGGDGPLGRKPIEGQKQLVGSY